MEKFLGGQLIELLIMVQAIPHDLADDFMGLAKRKPLAHEVIRGIRGIQKSLRCCSAHSLGIEPETPHQRGEDLQGSS